jgi:short-subunit dehydrogenase
MHLTALSHWSRSIGTGGRHASEPVDAITGMRTDDVARLVALNTTALLRLASAVAPRLAKAGEGAIVNIGSVLGWRRSSA